MLNSKPGITYSLICRPDDIMQSSAERQMPMTSTPSTLQESLKNRLSFLLAMSMPHIRTAKH